MIGRRKSMDPITYNPLPDIKRYTLRLLRNALNFLQRVGFGNSDEIDTDAWKAAVNEMKEIINKETLGVRLFPYLGRLHFVVASLKEVVEGQRGRVLKREHWLGLLDEQRWLRFQKTFVTTPSPTLAKHAS